MTWRPVSPAILPTLLAEQLARSPGVVRVAVDGPPCAEPHALAAALAEALLVLGRPFVHVRAESFWRDASLRFEFGREDVQSYGAWLDHAAVQREVLWPALESGTYLPSLRDPATNRSTHASAVAVAPGTVLVVSGPLLLGLGLDFDVTIHLAMSPAARVRRTSEDEQWTLPAFDDYDATVRPREVSDVVVTLDSLEHPAVRGLI